MPIASPEVYREMLQRAGAQGYALPSINITSSTTLHGVLAGLAEAETDGIVGIGLGGARFASGAKIANLAAGARALAEFAHVVAEDYPINIALHTDHCPPAQLDVFVRPLIEISRVRLTDGKGPLFQSHMFDGSRLDLADNLSLSRALLAELEPLGIVMEMEIGLVGGEEDEIDNRDVDAVKLYTAPADMVAVVDALGPGQDGRYMVAASFGNVHGLPPAGEVQLDPGILERGQKAIEAVHGPRARLPLVFHGGSGSSIEDIHESITHGVVKMNVDTDTQYAYTRAVAAHMFANFDQVLAIDGSPASKAVFEQRSWMAHGEAAMAERVVRVCQDLLAGGTTLGS